jgi:hypothetical protein
MRSGVQRTTNNVNRVLEIYETISSEQLKDWNLILRVGVDDIPWFLTQPGCYYTAGCESQPLGSQFLVSS